MFADGPSLAMHTVEGCAWPGTEPHLIRSRPVAEVSDDAEGGGSVSRRIRVGLALKLLRRSEADAAPLCPLAFFASAGAD
jgi:hypothetical protein